MADQYCFGLDLGQFSETSGLAILEVPQITRANPNPEYRLRHLERFVAGTSFTTIVDGVTERAGSLKHARPVLVVNETAMGTRVINPLRKIKDFATFIAITITSGLNEQPRSSQVPRKELITGLQWALQNHRLKVAPSLSEFPELARELSSYRMKATPMANTMLWRETPQDDLIFAVAMAVWYADRHFAKPKGAPYAIETTGYQRYF
jgi:hypothetical protein